MRSPRGVVLASTAQWSEGSQLPSETWKPVEEWGGRSLNVLLAFRGAQPATNSVYPGSQPLTTRRWDTILSSAVFGTRQTVSEGEITAWPVPQPALQPPITHSPLPNLHPALEIPVRHLSTSPHPHKCRLGTAPPFSGDMCWESVHALNGAQVLLSSSESSYTSLMESSTSRAG